MIVARGKICHPDGYLTKQIIPKIKNNKMHAEVVWTYTVARKFEDNLSALVEKLCGRFEELAQNTKLWLETNPYPTRKPSQECRSWRPRVDLAVGCIELDEAGEAQIRSNGDWHCLAEAKWFDDFHPNSKFPEVSQFLQIIEHALLLHDEKGNFPDRVYVTLITPEYFKEASGCFSERDYARQFQAYATDPQQIERDLRLCPLPFDEHNLEVLLSRISLLTLNWVTFEELLGLPALVEHHVPGKTRTTRRTWDHVFLEMGRSDLIVELSRAGE